MTSSSCGERLSGSLLCLHRFCDDGDQAVSACLDNFLAGLGVAFSHHHLVLQTGAQSGSGRGEMAALGQDPSFLVAPAAAEAAFSAPEGEELCFQGRPFSATEVDVSSCHLSDRGS